VAERHPGRALTVAGAGVGRNRSSIGTVAAIKKAGGRAMAVASKADRVARLVRILASEASDPISGIDGGQPPIPG